MGLEVFEEIVKRILIKSFNLKPSFSEISSIVKLAGAQTGRKIFVNNFVEAFRERDSIIIFKVKIKKSKKIKLRIGETAETWLGTVGIERWEKKEAAINTDKNIEFIDADNASEEFILRPWENGDSFTPLGMKGKKKISDFLTDVQADSINKKEYLVLTNNNRIVWLVGFRIANEFRVKISTRKVLKLWVN